MVEIASEKSRERGRLLLPSLCLRVSDAVKRGGDKDRPPSQLRYPPHLAHRKLRIAQRDMRCRVQTSFVDRTGLERPGVVSATMGIARCF